jgi:hypothetical protein
MFCVLQVMVDPVIAVDGFTYERHAIEQHFADTDDSPQLETPVADKTLIPNEPLRKLLITLYGARAPPAS